MTFAAAVFRDLGRLRAARPLVVNITNNVVTNTTANALLALGASPAMTHHAVDAAELAALAGAVVCNMGTPGEENVTAMLAAADAARAAGVPVVFDPVAAGVTSRRRAVARAMLEAGPVAAIRGNASEILALAGEDARAKGADSRHDSQEAAEAAARLAGKLGCVVCVSGAVDVVTDGSRRLDLAGGHALMPLVTGLGCTATAFVGAFAALGGDPFAATVHAMAAMAAAGAVAGTGAAGPGSFFVRFLDAAYGLTEADIAAGARLVA
ncbi:MAG: hydroxyethylthiazole kinase [Solidesulfovibrio sp. DCME]|uniref:hydroxyethylthiazole kinase n=1 Tax=Solidesulfovibrio sp. DCME TaxID=3447380 RepID=UPI003D103CC8